MPNLDISSPIQDASVDTSYFQTLVLTGQSNTAAAGLYQDLELLTKEEINATFGASSHLAAMLRDVNTTWENSLVKPKLWAASYADKSVAVARILTATVSGTSTEERTLKLKINSLNPDRIASQEAAILALRNTKSAYCAEYALNGDQFGAPKNAAHVFTPKLTKATVNDVIVEVVIPKSTAAAAAAALINTAINAKAESIYGSAVSTATLTLTAKHKGSLSNLFAIEVVNKTLAAGLTLSIVEDTAGSDVVDATGILNLTDPEGTALSDLTFNFVVAPISYSITNLVTDAKLKWDNVTNYRNKSKPYLILRSTAIDTTSGTAINDLASAQPIETNGIVKTLAILKTIGLTIRGVTKVSEINALKAKQFTAIEYEPTTGLYSVGQCTTLSNIARFKDIESVLATAAIRKFLVEIAIPPYFGEKRFTTGELVDSDLVNKADVVEFFEVQGNILDGTNKTGDYGDDYAGLIVNSAAAKARLSEVLNAETHFDPMAKQVATKFLSNLTDPIRSIFIINSVR